MVTKTVKLSNYEKCPQWFHFDCEVFVFFILGKS